MSNAEILAEVFAVALAIVELPGTEFITNFTDNDAAKAAANRGSSSKEGMARPANWLDDATHDAGIIMRTVRVTTKENAIADALSRGDVEYALEMAAELGLIARRLEIQPTHALYELAVLVHA